MKIAINLLFLTCYSLFHLRLSLVTHWNQFQFLFCLDSSATVIDFCACQITLKGADLFVKSVISYLSFFFVNYVEKEYLYPLIFVYICLIPF